MGDKVETKSGKKGVITHVHKKSGYLFIHDPGEGKTYHVSWGSVTQINGKSAAEVAGKGDGLGEARHGKAGLGMAGQGKGSEHYWQSPAGKAILEAQSKPKGKGDGLGEDTFELVSKPHLIRDLALQAGMSGRRCHPGPERELLGGSQDDQGANVGRAAQTTRSPPRSRRDGKW